MKKAEFPGRQVAEVASRRDWLIGSAAALSLVAAIVGGAVLARPPVPLQGTEAKDALAWSELRPASRQPLLATGDPDLAQMRDSDPRAAQLLRRMRSAADNVAAVHALDGRDVSLLGYVVPLDGREGRDFLLVPYFGACIHTPPPPANQVVHVTAREGLRVRTMDRVLVRGILHVEQSEHALAASSYVIREAQVVVH